MAGGQRVWGLQESKKWVTSSTTEGVALPFWPELEFAQACGENHWPHAQVKSVTLHMFRTDWLIKMYHARQKVVIFPHPDDLAGLQVEPLELLEHIRLECQQYE
jgi:hypothetical protein